jgi:dihydrofolate reductase
MNISIIVSIDKNNGIGKDNKLLCKLQDDLMLFKKITLNKTVIMGRKTYESLPIKPLPKRNNIIISNKTKIYDNCFKVSSVEESLILSKTLKKDIFIIGGSSIYEQFLPLCNNLYITLIDNIFISDRFFPKIDYNKWKLITTTNYKKK